MKKIIPLLLVTLIFSACGKLEGKLKSKKKSSQLLSVTSEKLTPQEFAIACANKIGVLEYNSTICVYESLSKALANGAFATSQTTADYDLGDIASGTAVKVFGTVNNNSVELVLNHNPLSAIPSNRLITTNGGRLAFRLRPGTFYGVKVSVYTCLGQAMQPVRCPY